MFSEGDYLIEHSRCMISCLFVSNHTLLLYTPQPVHYNLLCVFFPFDQMLLSKDWTGDPWATWMEISFGAAWFYLARCCLSPLTVQPIMSNSNILRRGLCIFNPKSFCKRDDYYREKAYLLFFSLITLSYNKNNVSSLKILSMSRSCRECALWLSAWTKEGWWEGLSCSFIIKAAKAILYYTRKNMNLLLSK